MSGNVRTSKVQQHWSPMASRYSLEAYVVTCITALSVATVVIVANPRLNAWMLMLAWVGVLAMFIIGDWYLIIAGNRNAVLLGTAYITASVVLGISLLFGPSINSIIGR